MWSAGDQVRWKGRGGAFRRDVGDGEHAEIVVAERVGLTVALVAVDIFVVNTGLEVAAGAEADFCDGLAAPIEVEIAVADGQPKALGILLQHLAV